MSSGCKLSAAESFFEFFQRFNAVGQLRLFGQHYGNAVADRISHSADFADEYVVLKPQLAKCDRATQRLHQKFIDGACGHSLDFTRVVQMLPVLSRNSAVT